MSQPNATPDTTKSHRSRRPRLGRACVCASVLATGLGTSCSSDESKGSDRTGRDDASVASIDSGLPPDQTRNDEGAKDAGTPSRPDENSPDASAQGDITWHGAVAPLLISRCGGCHTQGGIAPFALDTYEQASALSELALESVLEGTMPPFLAENTDECKPRLPFKDDPRLTLEEEQILQAWVDLGTPEGNPKTAREIPAIPSLALGPSAKVYAVPGQIEVEGPGDRFLCFAIDPGLTQNAWLKASQVIPGNSAIVHHVLTYVDSTGESAARAGDDGYYDCFGGPGLSSTSLISAWAPGSVPLRTPPEVAIPLPAGSLLVVNVHYHPTGVGAQVDEGTQVQLELADEAPEYEGALALIGNFAAPNEYGGLLAGDNDSTETPEFRIPAGARAHVEAMDFKIPQSLGGGIRVWAMGTHMHYVGTDMVVTVSREVPQDQPAEECLIQTPRWDFNWQRGYFYDAPLEALPVLKGGDTLHMRCTYDNSLDNPFVREALDDQGLTEPRDVLLGEETLDEMCLGVFGVATPR